MGCHCLLHFSFSWSLLNISCIVSIFTSILFICTSILFLSFFYLILFFNFTILYWFCHVSTWIHHRYTHFPHPEPSSLLPPHTILLPLLWILLQVDFPVSLCLFCWVFLPHSFICCMFLCIFIWFNLLFWGSPFCRLQGHSSSYLWSLSPMGRVGQFSW